MTWSQIEKNCMKNLIVICIGFLLLFCAYQSLANLQSTMNMEEGLGVASQSIIYAALIVSAVFLPKLMIKKVGCKWTLVLSIVSYCPYIAANFYPSKATLIPTSILLGFGGAPLWCSKCTYLNIIANRYASSVKEAIDVIVSGFFGIFFAIFQTTQIWGNLISYYVLKPLNGTRNEDVSVCGATFCFETNTTNSNLSPPERSQRYMLTGIYLSCAVLAAIIVAIFLDPLERQNDSQKKSDENVREQLAATLKHMLNVTQILLIPITVYSGLEQAFFLSDFTLSFIACSWGVYHVGFVFICYGVVNVVMSFTSGRLVKYIPRLLIVIVGFLGNIMVIITMFLWKPNEEQSYMFFIIAGLWGFSDAIWQSQLNALYGLLFHGKEEAAFANYRLWESMGFLIAFAYGQILCTDAKIYVLLAFGIVGMIGYITTEIGNLKLKIKKQDIGTPCNTNEIQLDTTNGCHKSRL